MSNTKQRQDIYAIYIWQIKNHFSSGSGLNIVQWLSCIVAIGIEYALVCFLAFGSMVGLLQFALVKAFPLLTVLCCIVVRFSIVPLLYSLPFLSLSLLLLALILSIGFYRLLSVSVLCSVLGMSDSLIYHCLVQFFCTFNPTILFLILVLLYDSLQFVL